MTDKDPHRYDDMLYMPHFVSKNRKRMSMHERAAQFAPFRALTGYEDSIEETARLTDEQMELSETERSELDRRIQMILNHIKEKPLITITYFIPDERKEGGRYVTVSFRLRNADLFQRVLIGEDRQKYPIDRIIRIGSDLFTEEEY